MIHSFSKLVGQCLWKKEMLKPQQSAMKTFPKYPKENQIKLNQIKAGNAQAKYLLISQIPVNLKDNLDIRHYELILQNAPIVLTEISSKTLFFKKVMLIGLMYDT